MFKENTMLKGQFIDPSKEGIMNTFSKQVHAAQNRRLWESPVVKSIGTLGALLECGLGKSSTSPGDPGEVMKNPNTDK
jgi:hypothetical protein